MTKGESEIQIAALTAERDKLQDVVQELHDEIVAQDKEYKAMGEMCLKLGEENKKLKERIEAMRDLIEHNDDIINKANKQQWSEGPEKARNIIAEGYVYIDDDLVDKVIEAE